MEVGLLALVALACPIGMGLMMWFMAKGMGMGREKGNADLKATEPPSLNELRAEQERLASQISKLDRDKTTSSAL
jgi:hypothetical protein